LLTVTSLQVKISNPGWSPYFPLLYATQFEMRMCDELKMSNPSPTGGLVPPPAPVFWLLLDELQLLIEM